MSTTTQNKIRQRIKPNGRQEITGAILQDILLDMNDETDEKQTVIDVTHPLDYDLISNKPVIPEYLSDLTEDSTHRLVTDTQIATWNNKQDEINTVNPLPYDYISGKPVIPTVPTNVSAFANDAGYLTEHQSLSDYYNKSQADQAISGHHDDTKQDKLVSGTNIKTINNESILGSGNITITGTSDYDQLSNRPSINNVVLTGNKASSDLGLQDTISDLVTIRSGAALGATALQEHQSLSDYYNKSQVDQAISGHHDDTKQDVISSTNKLSYNYLSDTPVIPSEVTETTVANWGFTKNAGTITGITMNGASKGTSGNIDLGTVITSHQDISGKQDKSNLVTSISSSSTDIEYPSAKCVYDMIGNIESNLSNI